MEAAGFVDIETPMMGKPTPEGARDFLVPTRLQPGQFFALPQSPQIYKQLLVISGFERYYQIARCFRDEDLRADRLQELTQLDVEMAFPDQEFLFELIERIVAARSGASASAIELEAPFQRMTWDEAQAAVRVRQARPSLRPRDRGRDRADARLRVRRVRKRAVRPLPARSAGVLARRARRLEAFAKEWGAKGLAYLVFDEEGEVRSPIAKFLSEDELERFRSRAGDTVLFVADEPAKVARVLGALRLHLGRELELIDRDAWRFLWVTDFPLLEWDEEERRWTAVHHPFTRPTDEGAAAARGRPGRGAGGCLRPDRERDRDRRRLVQDPRAGAPAARSSTCSRSRPRSSGRSSASSSTRSPWARRRTAGSRRASTAWRWPCSTSRSSATPWRFRRIRPAWIR